MAGGIALSNSAWFSRLGQPLSVEDRAAAEGYAQTLALGRLQLQLVGDAAEAESATRDPDWDKGWWVSEENERKALMDEARSRLGAEVVLDALTVAVEPHTETTYRQALRAPLLRASGEALARAASGALMMALHCHALARLCGRGSTHLFMRKYELFSRGRWPLGVRDAKLLLF